MYVCVRLPRFYRYYQISLIDNSLHGSMFLMFVRRLIAKTCILEELINVQSVNVNLTPFLPDNYHKRILF